MSYKTQDLIQDCMADWKSKSRKVRKGAQFGQAEFKELFCRACRNPVCINHQAGDPFANRMSTQADRLLNPTQADPNLPKYANIVQADFANLIQRAAQLEISAKRNDWTPVETPSFDISDGKPIASEPDVVDEAVKKLAEAQGREAPELPKRNEALWDRAKGLAGKKSGKDDYVQVIYDRLNAGAPEEPEGEAPEEPPTPPAPQHPKKPIGQAPGRGNTQAQGGMLDGSLPPSKRPVHDPWAVTVDPRKAGGRRVKAGARVKLTATGVIDDE